MQNQSNPLHSLLKNSLWLLFLLPAIGCEFESIRSNSETSEVLELPRHWLVFAHHADDARKDYDIWRVSADGTQMASLVTLPGHQTQIAISPDGSELIYTSPVEGKYDLWRRKFEGGKPVNITNHPASDSSPSWSPDGKQIAFCSDRDEEKPELYVMDLESGIVNRMTENKFHDSGTSWSPDGKTILFTRFVLGDEETKQSGSGEVVAIDVATKAEKQLTKLNGYCGGVEHSPDGKRIAFHRTSEEGSEIWVMNVDGSNPTQITQSFLDEYSPAWSPDGNWIAYTSGTGSDGNGTFDLWMMLPDGTEQRLISKAANTQMNPEWRFGKKFSR